MLIFDKNKQYENLMNNGFETYPNKRDLQIVAEKWLDEGCAFDTLKSKLFSFCQKWNAQTNYAKVEPLILRVLEEISAEKDTNFVFQNEVDFFVCEKELILSLSDDKMRRILFIMLCLAKWRNANYIYINSGSSIKIKDIFSLSGVKATQKEQLQILHKLNDLHVIDVQLKPILKIFIPFIVLAREAEPLEKTIRMSETMIDELLTYTLPHCARCGRPFIKRCNKQIYCKECREILDREQKLKYIHKIRGVE